jgi:hypothetical protein
MSLASAATLAVHRDLTSHKQPVRCVTPTSVSSRATVDDTSDTGLARFSHIVAAQIPSEALIAYTTLMALLTVSKDGYHEARWAIYAASVPACGLIVLAAYVQQRGHVPQRRRRPRRLTWLPRTRHPLPWLSIVTPALAMGVYGLTVPGSPLQYAMSGTGFAVTSGSVSVAGGLALTVVAPFLAQGNAASVRTPRARGGSRHRPPDRATLTPVTRVKVARSE